MLFEKMILQNTKATPSS